MSTENTRVAVVVPVYNRRETTLQCLRSLSRLGLTGIELRIFVVNDASTDGTAEAIGLRFPNVQIVGGDGTLYYPGGTNRGITAAMKWEPDFILAINDDEVFHDEFLQRMLATASANPRSIIGALLLLWDEPHRAFQVGLKWDSLTGGWDMPHDLTAFSVPKEPFEVECIVGNCVLYPVEAIRECGLMDDVHFKHHGADAEYTVRMRKHGWRLFIDPRAYVWCQPNSYPPPLHKLSAAGKLKAMFTDERQPQNLKRQLRSIWYCAPTKASAVIASGAHLTRMAAKAIGLGRAPADGQS